MSGVDDHSLAPPIVVYNRDGGFVPDRLHKQKCWWHGLAQSRAAPMSAQRNSIRSSRVGVFLWSALGINIVAGLVIGTREMDSIRGSTTCLFAF